MISEVGEYLVSSEGANKLLSVYSGFVVFFSYTSFIRIYIQGNQLYLNNHKNKPQTF